MSTRANDWGKVARPYPPDIRPTLPADGLNPLNPQYLPFHSGCLLTRGACLVNSRLRFFAFNGSRFSRI
ncbi:hypothetical protein SBA4_3390015 [Candidatus Sulfopaludibacter sp. SbA4]|nr:hypothetical protein SBA4_3390015 [Candidatus Sulfopaludibacter sp. SbA4]